MIARIKRLGRLRRLLSASDRLNELEARNASLQKQVNTLQNRGTRLQKQVDTLKDHRDSLRDRHRELQKQVNNVQLRVDALQKYSDPRLDYVIEDLDALKSSFEVPQELVDDFREWKARTPIPERPLISVCVATYNRARLLTERCIPSVLGQTYTNLELIVVGDCCSDETERTVAGIEDPRFTFVNLAERGSYPKDLWRRWMVAGTPAMNKALSMTNGDFITHLDDDDEYFPQRLEKLVEFATAQESDFIWHPFWTENEEGAWFLNEGLSFALGRVTTSSVLYRSWFKRITWDINAHRVMEPGDWNRFRKIKYIGPKSMRYPEPLLRHYRERNQAG